MFAYCLQVDYDLDQGCPVPEALGDEIEVAVLQGIPVFREALLLHKPTGALLSSDLLLSMDNVSYHALVYSRWHVPNCSGAVIIHQYTHCPCGCSL